MPPAYKNEDWAQKRESILYMIRRERKSQAEVRDILEREGFRVTKEQLRYRLKLWDSRVRYTEGVWKCVGYRLQKRKRQHKKTTVVINGELVDPATVQRETNRHMPLTYHTRPQTPDSFAISVSSPHPLQLTSQWPETIPWLRFEKGFSGISFTGSPRRLKAPLEILGLRAASDSSLSGIALSARISAIATEIGCIMPETSEGGIIGISQQLLATSIRGRMSAMMRVLLYCISNNLLDFTYRPAALETLWKVLHDSGITRIPLQATSSTDPTIVAFAEGLLDLALTFGRKKGLSDARVAVFKWLLSSRLLPGARIRLCVKDLLHSSLSGSQNEHSALEVVMAALDAASRAAFDFSKDLHRFLKMAIQNFRVDKKYKVIETLMTVRESTDKCHGEPRYFDNLLMVAISKGDIRAVRMLIDHGEDATVSWMNPADILEVKSPATLAAGLSPEQTAFDMVQYLYHKLGPTLPDRANFLRDSVISASLRGNTEVLKMLLDNKGDPDAIDSRGFSALHMAAIRGHTDTCKLLLGNGAGRNLSRKLRSVVPSPFHLSILSNCRTTMQLLYGTYRNIGRRPRTDLTWHAIVTTNLLRIPRLTRTGFQSLPLWFQLAPTSPMGAALLHAAFETEGAEMPSYQRLMNWGFDLPEWALYFGALIKNTGLVSVAISYGLDPNHPIEGDTALRAALRPFSDSALPKGFRHGHRTFEKRDEAIWTVDVVIVLLGAGAKPIGGESNAAAELDDLQIFNWIRKLDPEPITKGMLELALFKSPSLVHTLMDLLPDAYSPRMIHAATMSACKSGDLVTLHRLLQRRPHGANTTKRQIQLETHAVCIASENTQLDVLRVLLQYLPPSQAIFFSEGLGGAGRCSNGPYDERIIASPLAAACHSLEVVDILLEHGYQTDWYALSRAVCEEREIIETLLNSGISPLAPTILADELIFGSDVHDIAMPLCVAIEYNDADIVQQLLESGQDINDNSGILKYGRSPLQLAIERKSFEIMDILLNSGASVSTPAAEYGGVTALQAAAIGGQLGIAKKLIDLGADFNQPGADYRGRTALEGAAEHGRIDMVQLLLESGVSTAGSGRSHFFRAKILAENQHHFIAARLLKDWSPLDAREEVLYRFLAHEELLTCAPRGYFPKQLQRALNLPVLSNGDLDSTFLDKKFWDLGSEFTYDASSPEDPLPDDTSNVDWESGSDYGTPSQEGCLSNDDTSNVENDFDGVVADPVRNQYAEWSTPDETEIPRQEDGEHEFFDFDMFEMEAQEF